MCHAPRVTVVTPTYNRADYLAETIESILAQSFRDFEYIVVDDGSTDSTAELVASYGGRVRYVYHPNRGEAGSTNVGWKLARGEYFAMVSSDDPMPGNWLEESVAFMDEHPDVLVGYPDWLMIDESSKVIRKVKVYEYHPERLYGWVHCLPGPGAVVRKAALPAAFRLRDERYRFVSDLESWFRLGLVGKFARIPRVLATWRNHVTSTSITERSLERSRETLRLVRRFYASAQSSGLGRYRRMATSRAYYLAAVFVRRTYPVRAAAYLMCSIAWMPVEPEDMPKEIRRRVASRILQRRASEEPGDD